MHAHYDFVLYVSLQKYAATIGIDFRRENHTFETAIEHTHYEPSIPIHHIQVLAQKHSVWKFNKMAIDFG